MRITKRTDALPELGLARFLVLLGSDVEIVVKSRTRATALARVLVA